VRKDLRVIDGGDDEPFEDLESADRATAGQSRARRTGDEFVESVYKYVESAGARIARHNHRIAGEVDVDARIVGENDRPYWLLAHGTIDDGPRAGLRRTDTVLKTIGAAYLLSRQIDRLPVILIASHLPSPRSASGRQLAGARLLFWDVIASPGDLAGRHRLQAHLRDPEPQRPTNVPWMCAGVRKKELGIGQMAFEQGDEDA